MKALQLQTEGHEVLIQAGLPDRARRRQCQRRASKDHPRRVVLPMMLSSVGIARDGHSG